MKITLVGRLLLGTLLAGTACTTESDSARRSAPVTLAVATQPIATVAVIDADTLSDSLRILRVSPEPDGGSVAFLFADPTRQITGGLALAQASGAQKVQLVWPDSVSHLWWSKPHELSFTSGTGQGVRVVIDAHAAQLQAIQGAGSTRETMETSPGSAELIRRSLSRAQAFVDSVRVQPTGAPHRSTLRYSADTILIGPGDSLAAIHVMAVGPDGRQANPTWYLMYLPNGDMHPLDSLVGALSGLVADAGQWGADGAFYYAKDRSIWRARPTVH